MFLSKYGAARHIYVPVNKRSAIDYAASADWTPAAGDVKISKDGGAAANVTNLPVAITMGNTAVWDFSLTATEMQAAQVIVTVADAATKAVEDQTIIVETYGNASAQHEFDLDTPTVALTAAAITTSTFAAGAINAAAIAADAITDAKVASDVTIASVTGAVGSVTGAVGSVTGAVGSVTGAVGSVTGNVGGNVTGSVGSVATGGITAASIATDAIGAAELAADAVAEIAAAAQSGLATSAALATLQADTDDIQTRLPAALVSGRIDASVGAAAANSLTASALATDAVTEIVNAFFATLLVEPAGEPTFASDLKAHLSYWAQMAIAEWNATATSTTLRNIADSGNVATYATSDDGTTFVSGPAT